MGEYPSPKSQVVMLQIPMKVLQISNSRLLFWTSTALRMDTVFRIWPRKSEEVFWIYGSTHQNYLDGCHNDVGPLNDILLQTASEDHTCTY